MWLTYWIIFGFFTSLDEPFSWVFALIPGYYAFRFLFYIWLIYPRERNGAVVIYLLAKPLLQNLKERINK
jgi:hypothetical protein